VTTHSALPAQAGSGTNGRRLGWGIMAFFVVMFCIGILLVAGNVTHSDAGLNAGVLLAILGGVGGLMTAIIMTVKYGGPGETA
jgi:hypothetical protein